MLSGESGAVEQVVVFLERNPASTFPEAIEAIGRYGEISPVAFDRIHQGWGIYWHRRDMPAD